MDQRIGNANQDYPKDIPRVVYDSGNKVGLHSSIDFDYTKIYAERDYQAPIRALKSCDCTPSLGTGDNTYLSPSPNDAAAVAISPTAAQCGSGISTRSELGRKGNFNQSSCPPEGKKLMSFQLFNLAPFMDSMKKAWTKQSDTFRRTCRNRLVWRKKPKSSSSLYLLPHFHTQWKKTGKKLKAWLTAKTSLHHSCMSKQGVI